jgi:GMP synthase (glutamine-hydrolysing)
MIICIFDCGESGDTAKEIRRIVGESISTIIRVRDNKISINIDNFDGFIISGVPKSVFEDDKWINDLKGVILTKKPVLGICFGHQLIAHINGGKIEDREDGYNFGYENIDLTENGVKSRLFDGLPNKFVVFSTHREHVTRLPKNSNLLAVRENDEIQAFSIRNYFGVQFHPEMSWEIANNLGKKRKFDPKYPGEDMLVESRKMNSRILKNFVSIVTDSII